MLIIIIIGKAAVFGHRGGMEDSAILLSVFTFFLFCNSNVFDRIKPSLLCPTPNPEDQVSVFLSSCGKVAQLCPQAPGSLFLTFYNSQGYGGIILIYLHMGMINIYWSKKCIVQKLQRKIK
jgi:hypothetical protein